VNLDTEFKFQRSWYNLLIVGYELLIFLNNLLDDENETFISAELKSYRKAYASKLKPVSIEALRTRLVCLEKIETYIVEPAIKRVEWDAQHPKGLNLLEDKNLDEIYSPEISLFNESFRVGKKILEFLIYIKENSIDLYGDNILFKYTGPVGTSREREIVDTTNFHFITDKILKMSNYLWNLHELISMDLMDLHGKIVDFKIKNLD